MTNPDEPSSKRRKREPLKIGLLGCGAINSTVAKLIANGTAGPAVLCAVLTRTERSKEDIESLFSDCGEDEPPTNVLFTKPTLFHCVVRKTSGLTHCLSGVRLGDVVEILEEGVGPDKAYNLCRLPAKDNEASLSRDTYGWFPIRWLQKLEHYESMVREQQGQLLSRRADPPEAS